MKFRKRPIVVEAAQWNGDMDEMIREFGVKPGTRGILNKVPVVFIDTLEGLHIVRPGDWIIRGVRGEFYGCKPDIFAETYEEIHDSVQEEN